MPYAPDGLRLSQPLPGRDLIEVKAANIACARNEPIIPFADAEGVRGPALMSQERWSGGFGFVLASMGSAIGLGSIWKFPYEAGANGGGGFVIAYLLGVALIVTPLLLAEFAIGRAGRADATESLRNVAVAAGHSPRWAFVGWLGVLTAFLILSFYAVIGGWALAYAVDMLTTDVPETTGAARAQFDALLASPTRIFIFHALFMGTTSLIVASGVEKGIEAASRLLMPGLLLMIAGLAIHSVWIGDARTALNFLFAFDLEKMSARVWLDAIGLGFFSIGVGLGSMITYAAYAGETVNLRQIALLTILGDTLVSFLAGLAIFPLVFAFGLDPAGGPGLMFVTLPVAFARMPAGAAMGFVFYILLVVSALGSAIALLEVVVAWLKTKRLSRVSAAGLAGSSCLVAGAPTVLSFNAWATWFPLATVPGFEHASFFEVLDFLTSDVMLPLGGLCLSLFTGWRMSEELLGSQLNLSARATRFLVIALRFVVPSLIVAATIASWLFQKNP